MGFGAAIRSCFAKYVTFSGRAVRSEFWYFFLFSLLVNIAATALDFAIFGMSPYRPLQLIANLALLLPRISVAVRRLHDIDRSGWWFFLVLVPIIGWIIQLIWYCTRGTEGDNRFGPAPPRAMADALP